MQMGEVPGRVGEPVLGAGDVRLVAGRGGGAARGRRAARAARRRAAGGAAPLGRPGFAHLYLYIPIEASNSTLTITPFTILPCYFFNRPRKS